MSRAPKALELITWLRGAMVDAELPPTDRHIVLTLVTHWNDARHGAWPSIALLCHETGRSDSAVYDALKRSGEAGLTTSKRRGHHSAWRDFIWPGATSQTSNGLEVCRADLQPVGDSEIQPVGRRDLQPVGPRTSRKNEQEERAPQPPTGGREREHVRFDELLAAWAARHCPGVDLGLVGFGINECRRKGLDPTPENVRTIVDRWSDGGRDLEEIA
jgi:hypothetical protein